MSVITLSDTLAAQIMSLRWMQIRSDVSYTSAFGSQSVEVSTPLWGVQLSSISMPQNISGEWQALLLSLKGQINQLALWNVARPAPIGTMRGTMTLNLAATQGDITMSIVAAGEVSKTLVAGDFLGIGVNLTQQVVMVTSTSTSDGSGIILVNITPPLKNNHLIAAAVTWDKPKALFRQTSSMSSWDYDRVQVSGFSLDLIEDVRA